MREPPQRFAGRFVLVVFCAVLLLPAGAMAAGERPSLAATAQYKAFVEYVKKLDGLVGQPTSTAQKATYEKELTAKLEAKKRKPSTPNSQPRSRRPPRATGKSSRGSRPGTGTSKPRSTNTSRRCGRRRPKPPISPKRTRSRNGSTPSATASSPTSPQRPKKAAPTSPRCRPRADWNHQPKATTYG